MHLWKKTVCSSAIAFSLLLSGCVNGESPEQEIFQTLEKVVELEASFEEQQDPLLELEKEESAIYEEILSLGMKEFDQIVKLSQEGLTLVEQKEAAMAKEKESIEAASAEFEEVKASIEALEDEKLKKEAQSLYQLMEQRYEAYTTLWNHYMEAVEIEKELYGLFQVEDLTLEELQLQINNLNESYDKVNESNETFNSFTEQYNKAKLDFYKQAGLNVSYDN
ncbi:Putative cell-wall binding lipoprotein [Bacillus sp. THAF10]|uniref:YkyA family protein n=1 Tax=Bacillus sp. THAF10 TaxID=2587848 RepID=UPI001268A865|nr:YkyA family protein [Bacillus sp. THAF10]QFT88701.1 Putative cell-wall binding lipoprotein [Bacillus sp. THAF10]